MSGTNRYLQDCQIKDKFGGVNPAISDSSTFTFSSPLKMRQFLEQGGEDGFIYARYGNPSTAHLASALATLENSESALVTASGMSAISSTVLQLCRSGDEIIASRALYGATYALFRNFLPGLGIKIHFVDLDNKAGMEAVLTKRTKLLYCESLSNPLLEISDIPGLSKLANAHGIKLIVDNTFSPLIISPLKLGAHVVLHSLTKFINGMGDCTAGCICSTETFIHELMDLKSGAVWLLGPVLDSLRASTILKNIHSLHIRMLKHSANAMFLAEQFEELGIKVFYPGLSSHNRHELMQQIANPEFGFGGVLTIDVGDENVANEFMTLMKRERVGHVAVSLGYFKTLFCAPSHSTSSEFDREEQEKIGLREGMIRISVGLDLDIQRTFDRIKKCLRKIGLV